MTNRLTRHPLLALPLTFLAAAFSRQALAAANGCIDLMALAPDRAGEEVFPCLVSLTLFVAAVYVWACALVASKRYIFG